MDETHVLRRLVAEAEEEAEEQAANYRRLVGRLRELERALKDGRVTEDVLNAVREALEPFTSVTPSRTRAVSAPGTPGLKTTKLAALQQKLKEL